jgi:uncharacterized protein YacL
MSLEFFIRIAGMILLGFGGLQIGVSLAALAHEPAEVWALVGSLLGALAGLVLTPIFTSRPLRWLYEYINRLPAQQLLGGVIGLVTGLIVAALLALPLSLLPSPYGQILPIVTALVLGYLGATVLMLRRRDVFEAFRGTFPRIAIGSGGTFGRGTQVLLDTSVIIDGRIADISQTGFIMGTMIVPRFVLSELQHIADSPDILRRNRGRRGLEILNRLQKESLVPVSVTDMDVQEVDAVDEKLVALAIQLGCAIVTNDFNLNRVAELQGVTVLNINDLANAVKAVLLPGEMLDVLVIQEGKELGQGIGYLEDGTMIVVEGGRRFLNQSTAVTVTKVLQTSAGRMIFAKPEVAK